MPVAFVSSAEASHMDVPNAAPCVQQPSKDIKLGNKDE